METKLPHWIIGSLVFFHFSIVFLDNVQTVEKWHNKDESKYFLTKQKFVQRYLQFPSVSQAWYMFSPPPKGDFHVLIQYKVGGDTTGWINILKPVNETVKNSFTNRVYAAFLSSFIFQSAMNILDSYRMSVKNNKDVETTILKCQGHTNLVRYSKYLFNLEGGSGIPISSTNKHEIKLRYKLVELTRLPFEQDNNSGSNIRCYQSEFFTLPNKP